MAKIPKRVQKEYKKIINPVENCKKKELARYQTVLQKAEFRRKGAVIYVKLTAAAGSLKGHPVIIEINLPSEYPFKAPDAKFLTPVYHPNVSSEGQVCKDVLSGDWGPAKQIIDIVIAIENLLIAPSTGGGPLNNEANEFFKANTEDAINKKQLAYIKKNNKANLEGIAKFEGAAPMFL